MKHIPDSYKLIKIRCESSAGSMVHHSEFELEACPGEVIRASYWSDCYFSMSEERAEPEKLAAIDGSYVTSGAGERTVREHIPADRALWEALAEEVEYLKDQLTPVKNIKLPLPDPDIRILDGGDYQRLYLTWETPEGEKTVQYYPPSGRRWSTVIDIIHEMARPVGRDLHRVGKTQMTEFFLKTPKYSYQITPVKDSEDYYFFVHGDKSPVSRITRSQWLTVREHLSGLDVSGFGAGRYESRYYLRLKYNDDMNKNLAIDKKTAGAIREFVRKSVLGE